VNDEKRGAIFVVTLNLNQNNHRRGRETDQVVSGDESHAEIKTGHRRVIEFLLSPVQKAANESLRER
jgi:hemolysin D